ncbi:putative polyamine transporter [Hortaea werneckii]|nr:putative polyamine transporter [Hortaea werneckii]KAI7716305.1 putative polyamine transporter [Hortaea werneckii]
MEEGRNCHQRGAPSRKQPEPSNDPNDPLNWPLLAKITTYGTICLFSFIANVNGSNFTVAVKQLANHFHTDLTHSTFLVGFNVLTFGLGNFLWVPMMRVLGKRPVYLLALALFVAANAWSTQAQSWNSLLGGRMVSGFATAAADVTVPSAVADIFFLEHRGHFQLQDWRWSCGFLAIAGGVVFVLAVFFIRDTQYQHRGYRYREGEIPKKRSYVGWLSLTVGFDSKTPVQTFFRTFWDIVRMAFYPPVFWVGCLVGVFVGWTIVIQVTASQLLTRSPYSWTLGLVGAFSISGWLGAILSIFFGGKMIDILANRARSNESRPGSRPEKRLIALTIPAFISPIGLIIYGQRFAHKKSWVGPPFGYAMHSSGFTASSNTGVTYAVDCYPDSAGEALVTIFMVRNIIALICSFYSDEWISGSGIDTVTGIAAGIRLAVLAVAIFFYFLSRQMLAFTTTYGPMRRSQKRP